MKRLVYVETTVISFLTARKSRDVVLAGQQEATRRWWDQRREEFDLYISSVVIDEAGKGDSRAAKKRMAALAGISVIAPTDEMRELAVKFIEEQGIPPKAADDALHLAVATVSRVQFLLTWNMKHLCSPSQKERLHEICQAAGYTSPIICTPFDLLAEA
ncbi:MAG: type II toxin-antitoxin system VapC family toxin [Pirellulaceae bacterium]